MKGAAEGYSRFVVWARDRLRLKHDWFDRLPLVVESSKGIPELLSAWPTLYPELVAWLSSTNCALSPAQLLDEEEFSVWPEDFGAWAAEWIDGHARAAHASHLANVRDAIASLGPLDQRVREALRRGELMPEERRQLSSDFRALGEALRALPGTLTWPDAPPAGPPDVLVIDDVLSRLDLLDAPGAPAPSPGARRALEEIRSAFCRHFRLRDAGRDGRAGDPSTRHLANAYFCAGQRWTDTGDLQNDLGVVEKAIREGPDGRGPAGWALLLVDLHFSVGGLDERGMGEEDSRFGVDAIIPMIRGEFPSIPAAALTADSADETISAVSAAGIEYLHRPSAADSEIVIQLLRGGRLTTKQARSMLEVPDDLVAEDALSLDYVLAAWLASRDEHGGTVLILGETGTGKERLARYIHDLSDRGRHDRPYMPVNCAQLRPELAAADLFGYYRGAFTSADRNTGGKFHQAAGGTLVLDEFAELAPEVQAMLLRALQSPEASGREIAPLGTGRGLATTVDVRVICCTNRSIDSLREELFFRIPHVVRIPPLRDRTADIAPLAMQFLRQAAGAEKGRGLGLTPDARSWLEASELPGNARTLRSLLQRARQGKGGRNLLSARDLQYAADELKRDRSWNEPSATTTEVRPAAAEARPSMQPNSVAWAVARLLQSYSSHEAWGGLTRQEFDDISATLRARAPEIISRLVEWACASSPDLPSAVEALTGERLRGPAPEQVLKRFLKLDLRVAEALAQSAAVPDNDRVKEVIEKAFHEFERRPRGRGE